MRGQCLSYAPPMKTVGLRKLRQFLKKNILCNFVTSRHHKASLKTPRGFVDILNPFRFLSLESCIVYPHFLIIPILFFFLYLVDISIGFFPEVRGVKNASSNSIHKGYSQQENSLMLLLFCIIHKKKLCMYSEMQLPIFLSI